MMTPQDIRRAHNRRQALELGRNGVDEGTIARQLRMPLFVVRVALKQAGIPIVTTPTPMPQLPDTAQSKAPHERPPLKRPRGRPPKPRPELHAQAQTPARDEVSIREVLSRFSEFRTIPAIAQGLHLSQRLVRVALDRLSPVRLAAWKELNQLRREVDNLERRRK